MYIHMCTYVLYQAVDRLTSWDEDLSYVLANAFFWFFSSFFFFLKGPIMYKSWS